MTIIYTDVSFRGLNISVAIDVSPFGEIDDWWIDAIGSRDVKPHENVQWVIDNINKHAVEYIEGKIDARVNDWLHEEV